MAQYRQSGGHHLYGDGASSLLDHVSIGIRGAQQQQQQKSCRARRSGRSEKKRAGLFPVRAAVVFLCLVLVATVLTYCLISKDGRGEINDGRQLGEDVAKKNADFLVNATGTDSIKVLGFGHDTVEHGRDSRYWDRDDRRRDEDYDEDDVEHARNGSLVEKGWDSSKMKVEKEEKLGHGDVHKVVKRRGVGLYNEDGRKELMKYEKEFEASLDDGQHYVKGNSSSSSLIDDDDHLVLDEAVGNDNEWMDSHDPIMDEYGDFEQDIEVEESEVGTSRDEDSAESSRLHKAEKKDHSMGRDKKDHNIGRDDEETENLSRKGSSKSQTSGSHDTNSRIVSSPNGESASKSRLDSKSKPKRRKHSGSCVMKFLNASSQIVEPYESRKFARFSLQYTEMEEIPSGAEKWEPRFAGHQSLQEREESFLAHDKKINCGFVKGPQGSPSTGFDLSEDDENYISRCHVAVVSCIFGNSDRLRSPANKMVSRPSRKNVCFVMFVDEITLQKLSSEGRMLDRTGFVGLWKIVLVKNLPYDDMRRVGKVPKFLTHRLFPSARYSIWLDSKLRFQQDPLLVLEYFLWRKGYEYAISKHYDRQCVWQEVAQNKKLNKYNHTVIDEQFSFYKADGLTRFNASDPNKLLPSNVPEGSLIVRAHTPMSNLFSCLWFNEVDRFTPRDQLSFAYTYQKLRRMNPEKPFYLNMFKDCERRVLAKLFRHKTQEKQHISLKKQQNEIDY